MRHARAADGLHERFLNDALFDVQGKFARSLLRRAPADAVRQAGNVFDLFCLDPFSFFGNGGGAVVGALGNANHLFNFA